LEIRTFTRSHEPGEKLNFKKHYPAEWTPQFGSGHDTDSNDEDSISSPPSARDIGAELSATSPLSAGPWTSQRYPESSASETDETSLSPTIVPYGLSSSPHFWQTRNPHTTASTSASTSGFISPAALYLNPPYGPEPSMHGQGLTPGLLDPSLRANAGLYEIPPLPSVMLDSWGMIGDGAWPPRSTTYTARHT